MRQIGEQWVEEIDGKNHMLKAVQSDHLCSGCAFSCTTFCRDPLMSERDIDCSQMIVIKDLGILREGKLPSSFGVYPTTVPPSEVEELWLLYSWVKNDGIVAKKEMAYGRTEQEAIDNWNRRSL